jgi:hypothetical protein
VCDRGGGGGLEFKLFHCGLESTPNPRSSVDTTTHTFLLGPHPAHLFAVVATYRFT